MARHDPRVYAFWDRVRAKTGIEGDFQDAWGFGDSPSLKDELLALVLSGRKRAATTLVREMEAQGHPEPKLGAYSVILDGSDEPAAVIRTVALRHVRFSEVDEGHALLEGEGDMTLETYRREHARYFRRVGERLGFDFDPDMEVVLERFELVYPLK